MSTALSDAPLEVDVDVRSLPLDLAITRLADRHGAARACLELSAWLVILSHELPICPVHRWESDFGIVTVRPDPAHKPEGVAA